MNKKILELREKIDRLDDEILELFDKRMEYVSWIGKEKVLQKSNIYHPKREQEILERLKKNHSKYLDSQAIEALYQEIFAISRNLELPQKVAFLGPIGSYTHQAAEEKFGFMSEYLPMQNVESIFKALQLDRVKYGVIPLENSISGIVGESIDLLIQSNMKIIAEIILPIHHSFVSNTERLQDVRVIYSKDAVFSQCGEFLESHCLKEVECVLVDSVAKAAYFASKEKNTAAICPKIAAKLYNVPVMFDNIEDTDKNQTRFIVVGNFSSHTTGKDKTSIFVTLKDKHKTGGLLDLLKDFAMCDINLTKIESRDLIKSCDFGFYIDFDGHLEDENVQKLFQKRQSEIKWLGSYVKEFVK